jgi:hypothetical protein
VITYLAITAASLIWQSQPPSTDRGDLPAVQPAAARRFEDFFEARPKTLQDDPHSRTVYAALAARQLLQEKELKEIADSFSRRAESLEHQASLKTREDASAYVAQMTARKQERREQSRELKLSVGTTAEEVMEGLAAGKEKIEATETAFRTETQDWLNEATKKREEDLARRIAQGEAMGKALVSAVAGSSSLKIAGVLFGEDLTERAKGNSSEATLKQSESARKREKPAANPAHQSGKMTAAKTPVVPANPKSPAEPPPSAGKCLMSVGVGAIGGIRGGWGGVVLGGLKGALSSADCRGLAVQEFRSILNSPAPAKRLGGWRRDGVD